MVPRQTSVKPPGNDSEDSHLKQGKFSTMFHWNTANTGTKLLMPTVGVVSSEATHAGPKSDQKGMEHNKSVKPKTAIEP